LIPILLRQREDVQIGEIGIRYYGR
jgi:hypothetical protein